MAKRKAVQDAEVAAKTRREGPADRQHRPRQGQVDRRLRAGAAACSAMAAGSASCSSSRAPGTPARRTPLPPSATASTGTRWARASPGRRRTRRATSRPPSAPGARRCELMADPTIGLVDPRRAQHRAALRLSRSRRGRRGAAGAPRRPARRRHRPQRQAGADRRRRSGDRDGAGQAPLRGRREGPEGHRVLGMSTLGIAPPRYRVFAIPPLRLALRPFGKLTAQGSTPLPHFVRGEDGRQARGRRILSPDIRGRGVEAKPRRRGGQPNSAQSPATGTLGA